MPQNTPEHLREVPSPREQQESHEPQERSGEQPSPKTVQKSILSEDIRTPQGTAEGHLVTQEEQEQVAIEGILSQGLDELYQEMSPSQRNTFKQEGESAARKIYQLLHAVTVQVDKIFNIIVSWLRMIPKINKFFIEQEAKIKTEKLLELRN